MTVILDANIVFSVLINPKSRYGEYLISNPDELIFISPNFLKKEIRKHKNKIIESAKYSEDVFYSIQEIIYSKIFFYSLRVIPDFIWNQASSLMEKNDDKDIPYLAFYLFFTSKIWTGDKVFCNKLISKGVDPCFKPIFI
jgi:predicted nucleic acid-binding protein